MALPALTRGLREPHKPALIEMAKAVALLGDPRGVPILKGLIQDKDWRVRLKVMEAFRTLANREALRIFGAALEDPEVRLRVYASRILLIRQRED